MKELIAVLSAFIVMTGCASGNTVIESADPDNYIVTTITERPPAERHVTAEEFEKEMGYSFNIPDGVEEIDYVIDTSTSNTVGFVGFYLDGVLWNAKVTQTDRSYYRDDLFEPYKIDFEELEFKPENSQSIKVHGEEPDVLKYYLIKYHSDTINDNYDFNAYWFLEDEGLELILQSIYEEPIHKVPVEVFDNVMNE